MTFLGTLLIFMAFFFLVGIGVIITKKTFRGCACSADPTNTTSCCKKETCSKDCADP
jgi:hypothetical protein